MVYLLIDGGSKSALMVYGQVVEIFYRHFLRFFFLFLVTLCYSIYRVCMCISFVLSSSYFILLLRFLSSLCFILHESRLAILL